MKVDRRNNSTSQLTYNLTNRHRVLLIPSNRETRAQHCVESSLVEAGSPYICANATLERWNAPIFSKDFHAWSVTSGFLHVHVMLTERRYKKRVHGLQLAAANNLSSYRYGTCTVDFTLNPLLVDVHYFLQYRYLYEFLEIHEFPQQDSHNERPQEPAATTMTSAPATAATTTTTLANP